MYPTLNLSLLAQPAAPASADAEATPLLEGAELDLADSFQASLTRSLAPAGEGGNPLPLVGTTLPESLLPADPAVTAELAEDLQADPPAVDLALPGIIVPDKVEVDLPVDERPREARVVTDSTVRTLLPVGLPAPATTPAAETTPADAGAAPALAAASTLRLARPPEPQPVATPTVKTELPERMPPAPVATRMGHDAPVPVEEPVTAAVLRHAESREDAASRPELAVNLADTEARRGGEQRQPAASSMPSLPPLEPGTVQAPATRPALNIAAPVQAQTLQSAPVDAPIQTPVGEPGFDDAVADRVWVMTQARLSNAEIRLTPAELGPVRIQVAVDDGTANVTFQAAQAATREAIEQALPRLRELLAENGLSLGQASVGEDGVRDGHRESPEQAAPAPVGDDPAEDIDNELAAAETPRPGRASRSLVDTFA